MKNGIERDDLAGYAVVSKKYGLCYITDSLLFSSAHARRIPTGEKVSIDHGDIVEKVGRTKRNEQILEIDAYLANIQKAEMRLSSIVFAISSAADKDVPFTEKYSVLTDSCRAAISDPAKEVKERFLSEMEKYRSEHEMEQDFLDNAQQAMLVRSGIYMAYGDDFVFLSGDGITGLTIRDGEKGRCEFRCGRDKDYGGYFVRMDPNDFDFPLTKEELQYLFDKAALECEIENAEYSVQRTFDDISSPDIQVYQQASLKGRKEYLREAFSREYSAMNEEMLKASIDRKMDAEAKARGIDGRGCRGQDDGR